MKLNIVCFLILVTICSCQYGKKPFFLNTSKYHLENDTCSTIQILSDNKIIINRDCEEHSKDEVSIVQTLNGEIIERYCQDLSYKVDSVDTNDGRYVSANDKNNQRCYGLHILDKDSFWIVTPLKSGDRINFDFTTPSIYKKIDVKNDLEFNETLIIQISKELEEGIFYIAYSQKNYANAKDDAEGNTLVELIDNTTLYKTNLEIDPSFYALKKYRIKLLNSSSYNFEDVPVLYHNEYSEYLKMSKLEKSQFHLKRNITVNFIVVHRFNPARERVVEKLYKEKIEGQVQSFELVVINNEY